MKFEEEFYEDKRVFKIVSTHTITGEVRHHEMVNTVHDYRKRLESHVYTPLIYKLSLQDRIGYLYGCFNIYFGNKRTEKFNVYSRLIGTNAWEEWFEITPSFDKI